VVKTMEEFLEDYNQINTAQMKLVLFMDAVTHVSRIARIIRQPLGNALLLGMGGSGRQSLTRLAAHMSEFDCFQIELAKNYGMSEWREDLRQVMMKAGLENKPMVFLFSDTQLHCLCPRNPRMFLRILESAFKSEFDCFQIELAKNYGMSEWREDLRQVMMKAGLENKPMVFLFSDTQ
ncbi:dynein heavy chain 1, axonemal-like, partial [Aplysia californica]|uniref:Dynein heavy chain 1, axonemal-like n=1 Tax=Aplysia californica TaxID=6500 RepID=A0ABM0KBK0_APLCA